MAYIEWTGAVLRDVKQREIKLDAARFKDELAQLETRGWSIFARGALGAVLAQHLSGIGRDKSGPVDRAAVGFVRLFELLRLEHMGCVFSIPILIGGGLLLLWLLDLCLGKPHGPPHLSGLCLITWIIAAGATSHTHFSGNETVRQRFWMGVIYFGSLIGFLAASVLVRV